MNCLQHDELVIADLTGLNPNVMFEVGYRFALEKDIIFIAQKGTNIPFDISTRRTFFYETSDAGFIILKDYLSTSVNNIQHRGKFQDYEGWWLEYIIDKDVNKFSIINIYYDNKDERYEFRGRNYSNKFNPHEYSSFASEIIVGDKNPRVLYYITDTTIEQVVASGKIIFNTPDEGIITAEGYYIDIKSADNVLYKHRTKMVKFNEAFWKKYKSSKSKKWPNDLSYQKIISDGEMYFQFFK